MKTSDGGMKVGIRVRLLEVGGDDGQSYALFRRVVDPETGQSQEYSGPTFKVPMTVDQARGLAALLYREIDVTVDIVPTLSE
jgi:hypothetical protein